jgi:hypothetical protein
MSNKTLKIDPKLFSLNKKKDKKDNKTKKDLLSKEVDNSNKLKKEMLNRVKNYQKNKEIERIRDEKKDENFEDNNFEDNNFEKEFNKSLNFLSNLAKKNKLKKNKTEKIKDNLDVNLNIPSEFDKQPIYSCLKNGNKPTYNQLNKTRKNDERVKIVLENNTYDNNNNNNNNQDVIINVNTEKENLESSNNYNTITSNINQEINEKVNQEINEKVYQEVNKELNKEVSEQVNELNSFSNTSFAKDSSFINNLENRKNEIIHLENENINENNSVNIPKINRLTRKKKYLLGKLKGKNKISILLKNNKTQKNIKEEIALLKKKDIGFIKNYLYEKNLIKRGSEAPNDILRKMYEDSILSGNISNSNTNNLVFNYLAV